MSGAEVIKLNGVALKNTLERPGHVLGEIDHANVSNIRDIGISSRRTAIKASVDLAAPVASKRARRLTPIEFAISPDKFITLEFGHTRPIFGSPLRHGGTTRFPVRS